MASTFSPNIKLKIYYILHINSPNDYTTENIDNRLSNNTKSVHIIKLSFFLSPKAFCETC